MTCKYTDWTVVANSVGVALVSQANLKNTFKCTQVVMIPHFWGLLVCSAPHKLCRVTIALLRHLALIQPLEKCQFNRQAQAVKNSQILSHPSNHKHKKSQVVTNIIKRLETKWLRRQPVTQKSTASWTHQTPHEQANLFTTKGWNQLRMGQEPCKQYSRN